MIDQRGGDKVERWSFKIFVQLYNYSVTYLYTLEETTRVKLGVDRIQNKVCM